MSKKLKPHQGMLLDPKKVPRPKPALSKAKDKPKKAPEVFSLEQMLEMMSLMADKMGKAVGEQVAEKLDDIDIQPGVTITSDGKVKAINSDDNDIIEIDDSLQDFTQTKEFNKSFDSIGEETTQEIESDKKTKLAELLKQRKDKA